MNKRIHGKTIFNIFVVIMSVGMIGYFCLSENGLSDLIKNAHNFNLMWLFLAVFCHLMNIFIDALLILKFTQESAKKYSVKCALKTCMVGQFFSAITPGASGGQPMQLYTMTKQGLDAGVSTSCLMQKFLIYQTALSMYSAAAIILRFDFFNNTLNKVMWGISILGFFSQVFVIGVILMFSFHKRFTHHIIILIFKILKKLHIIKEPQKHIQKIEDQLNFFHSGNKDLLKNKQLVIETYILTTIQLTLMFIIPYCIYRCFNLVGVRVIDMICSQAFVSMTSSLIPIPGASGASEGSFFVFFNNFFTPQTIKPAILLWRAITYYLTILISAPFSRITKNTKNMLMTNQVKE